MTAEEQVGTMAEEAAKLFAVLHATWARPDAPDDEDGRADSGDDDRADAGDDTQPPGSHAEGGEAAECRWCPLCRVVRVATSTSPEVRDHLIQAGLSFVLAIKALLEESESTTRRAAPVEKIDLSEG